MKYTVLIFSVISLILVHNAKALQEDTMDTLKTTINLYSPSYGSSSSGILKSHNGFSYTTGRTKTLYVTVPNGYSVLVSIRYIDLRPNNQDQLTLFSVNGVVGQQSYTNVFSYRKKQDYPMEELSYYVSSGNLGITFTTGPGSSYGYDGFKLIYTVQASSFRCSSGDFHCNNGRCIASILKCDGHNHCGDRSSQINCFILNSGRLTGIIFGCIFLVIAAAIGVYVIMRRRRGYISHTVVTSHPPPTTNMPSYPPHSQQGVYYPPPPPAYSQGVTNPAYH